MADGLIRIIVADDHRLFVASINAALTGTNVSVIDSTENPRDVLSLYELHKPDIVLCDIRFGDEPKGMDVLKELLFFDSKTKVVMFSHFDDAISILKAYQLGARAFLSKGIPNYALARALQQVKDGEIYIEPSIALKLAKSTIDSAITGPTPPIKTLSYQRKKQLTLPEASSSRLHPFERLPSVEIDHQLQLITKSISSINASGRLQHDDVNVNEKKALREAAIQLLKSLEEVLSPKNQPFDLEKTLSDVQSDEFRLLINRLDTALEAERKFIAMQLHDDIGASLVAIQFHTNFLKTLLDEKDALSPKVSVQLDTILSHLKRVHEITRNIGRNLRPEMLDVLGLKAALTSLINEYNGGNNFKIYSSFDENLGNLSSEIDIIIYRIVQEGLTNIIKHAKATEVYVVLEKELNNLTLSIVDNGIGFDPKKRLGTGLIGIREKANSINGDLSIESTMDQGTTLIVKLPLPTSPDEP